MDGVSAAIAIASIAGVFTSCVDCFEYIQIGKDFKDDFGYCLVRLEAAELRLTRWGASLGLMPPGYDDASPSKTDSLKTRAQLSAARYPKGDVEKAEKWLKRIIAAFEAAEEDSILYAKKEKLQIGDVYNTESDLERVDDSVKRLYTKIRVFVKNRKADVKSAAGTAKWALHGKKHFDQLVEKVSTLVNELVDLFPASVELQKEFSLAEVKELDAQDLPALKAAVQEDDPILVAAVDTETKEVLRKDPTLKFSDITIEGNAVHFSGEVTDDGVPSVSMEFRNIKAGGNSISMLGRISGKHGAAFMDSMSKAANSQPKHGDGG